MFGGDAVQTELMHFSRNWQAFASYSDINSGFRADYGFLPRVDVRTLDAEAHRLVWGDGKTWFTRLRFWLRGYYTADHSGRRTDSRVALGAGYEGPLQSAVQLVGRLNREFYLGRTYDVSDFVLALALKPAGGMSFALESVLGRTIDYNNIRPAQTLLVGPRMELGLGKHVNLTVYHSLERLESSGLRTYTANLSQVRLIYNFNVRSFVRAIIQYRDVDRVAERYVFPVDPHTKGVFTQFLFSYKINPQTVLFLGYSDNSLGLQGIDITRTDRTFFFKIGYALVL
jgi:hypothetical protein